MMTPVDRIIAGLPAAIAALRADAWDEAALAIMTTDTLPKAASRQVQIGGATVTVTGISKGAGMIRPKNQRWTDARGRPGPARRKSGSA